MSRTGTFRMSVLIGVVLFASYAFFYQGGGWNQNTRLDFARAVVEHGSVRIDSYAGNTGDKAVYQGHVYSDKAPGQPLLSVVPVAVMRPVLALTSTPPGSERGTRIVAYVATLATSSLPTAIAGALLFWVLLALGASRAGAAIGALAFGLATPTWAYATLLWANGLATLGLLVGFAACLALTRTDDERRRALFAVTGGFAAGWATITDFPVAPAALIVALLAFVVTRHASDRARVRAFFAGGALLPAAVFLGYNAITFGSLLHIGYASEAGFHLLHQGFMGITYPKVPVIGDILFSRFRGLLPLAPELLVVPIGLVFLGRSNKRPFAIAAAAIVVYFVMYNASYVYWSGGWTFGPRFIASALPFACLGLAPVWDRGAALMRGLLVALTVLGATLTLAAVATTPQLPSHVHSPMADIVFPAIRHNALSIGNQSFIERNADPAEAPTEREDDSWNLGLLLGLPGLASLLPLLAVWGAAAFAMELELRRAAPAGSVRPTSPTAQYDHRPQYSRR